MLSDPPHPRYLKAAEAPLDHSLVFADHDAELRYDTRAGERSLDVMRWGLVPFWAKDMKVGFTNINAKAEGIEGKPTFREAFQRRRCRCRASLPPVVPTHRA
jgi:putative SOS response-associated peptidase YedK